MMMSQKEKPATTQRAYTLRLRGVNPNDNSWRHALWQTHEAVNKGAKVFGDWLLTLRGGLDHSLVDTNNSDRTPTDEERKARRILLALSWLSVESERGAPETYIVASGKEASTDRDIKVIAAFEEILKKRKLSDDEIKGWIDDCKASLSAAIRDDAVWVNRSKAFDDAVKRIGDSLTREEVWDMLDYFFVSAEAYLKPIKISGDESTDTEKEEKAKDLVQKAGQWLSGRFGSGKGADFPRMAKVYERIVQWADQAEADTAGGKAISNLVEALKEFKPASEDLDGVLGLISGRGYKSATRNYLQQIHTKSNVIEEDLDNLKKKADEDRKKCLGKSGSKGQRLYADAILDDVERDCGFTYRVAENGEHVSVLDYSKYKEGCKWGTSRHQEFSVMLDHAARRVSLAHTWIKRAEAERRKFEEDAKKKDSVPKSASKWLDQFCEERSEASGALEPYRIRRKALDGWKDVVEAWSDKSCKTNTDRIEAARALQHQIDKFGDIQLFEALAADDARCVWHKDGNETASPDPQPLIDYVLAAEAEFNKQRFKVPAYRHPDALLHPVFCDFGNSRWSIDFSIREATTELNKAKKKLQKTEEAFTKATNVFVTDRENGKKREKLEKAKKELTDARQEVKRLSSARRLSMTLWTGRVLENKFPLCWQSKRLVQDLALSQKEQKCEATEVTRADRFGRAASNVTKSDDVEISGLFEQKDWNGRLQAPRQQLEAIAKVRDNDSLPTEERDRRICKMKDRIRWLVTFSAKLQPMGPWCDFAEKHRELELKIDPQYWPHAEENKKRKGQARLILSRLPGLRVLSVDLGHRYAAACAVWETVDSRQVEEACKDANHERPKSEDLYLHLKKRKNVGNDVEKTIIYRRIGADNLPNGTPHPAPWARLDRQFLIKLQGEEEGARMASNEEIWAVHQMEAAFGRSVLLIDRLVASGWGSSDEQKARLEKLKGLGWTPAKQPSSNYESDLDQGEFFKPSLSIDELMYSAVRTMRLALKRHGDRARIAFAMTAEYKTMPGDRRYYFTESKELSVEDNQEVRDIKRVEFIRDALVLWYDLAYSQGWRDNKARQLWDEYIAKLPEYGAFDEKIEESAAQGDKKRNEEIKKKLNNVAEVLGKNESLRKDLHDAWQCRWEEDDDQWKKQLRWFKDWILPRGKAAKDPAIRGVGGLSLTRLATLTEFRRKVQVGFFTRLRPDGTRAETKEGFGQSTLDALENLREQRVKQLASRIVEAALGVGRVKRPAGGKDPKRPDRRVDEPCHAIIIENLTNYRPEETRTRRENRQLMSWSSSKVQKYLSEACQLHGLHLREVSASYTSRQDSRTGAPGMRSQDVPVAEFMRSPFWRKQVKQAQENVSKNKGNKRERYLCDLNEMWGDKQPADWKEAGDVRIPLNGGEIFVSADSTSPAAKGLQADLNAAANIGLRALIEPDWEGKWWYVPCDAAGSPVKDHVEGSQVSGLNQALRQPEQAQTNEANTETKKRKSGRGKSREVINLWHDISSSELNDREWKDYNAYWNGVQYRVVSNLNQQMNGRNKKRQVDLGDDDVPF